MKQYFVMLNENARSIKNVHVIVGVSLFFALNVIMNLFVSVYITPEIKVGFASIATAASCYFYGPIPNLIVAPLLDFVNFIVKPSGTYFPIFMISTFATAAICSKDGRHLAMMPHFYGQDKVSLKRVILARLSYDIIVSLFLNSLFTSMLWGTPFWAIVSPKIVKNLICLPIQVVVLYLTMKTCTQLKPRLKA